MPAIMHKQGNNYTRGATYFPPPPRTRCSYYIKTLIFNHCAGLINVLKYLVVIVRAQRLPTSSYIYIIALYMILFSEL